MYQFLEENQQTLKETTRNIKELRLRIVNYILSKNAPGFQSNWDRFKESLKFNLQNQLPSLLNLNNKKSVNEEQGLF